MVRAAGAVDRGVDGSVGAEDRTALNIHDPHFGAWWEAGSTDAQPDRVQSSLGRILPGKPHPDGRAGATVRSRAFGALWTHNWLQSCFPVSRIFMNSSIHARIGLSGLRWTLPRTRL